MNRRTTRGQETGRTTVDGDPLAHLVASARRCFAVNGPRATRMAAVAQAAGMQRQRLYSFVSSRDELIELAFAARLRELMPEISRRSRSEPRPVAEEITNVFAVMTVVVRQDAEFIEYSRALGLERALRFLTGSSASLAVVAEILEPLYVRAVSTRALRPDISLDDMAWWASNMLAPVAVRADVDGLELRRIIRKFAVPALIVDSHQG